MALANGRAHSGSYWPSLTPYVEPVPTSSTEPLQDNRGHAASAGGESACESPVAVQKKPAGKAPVTRVACCAHGAGVAILAGKSPVAPKPVSTLQKKPARDIHQKFIGPIDKHKPATAIQKKPAAAKKPTAAKSPVATVKMKPAASAFQKPIDSATKKPIAAGFGYELD